MAGIMGANVMNAVDPNCARWIRRFRDPAAPAGAGAVRERRRRRG